MSTSCDEKRRGSPRWNGRRILLAKCINAIVIGLTNLSAFRERQNDMFFILFGMKYDEC